MMPEMPESAEDATADLSFPEAAPRSPAAELTRTVADAVTQNVTAPVRRAATTLRATLVAWARAERHQFGLAPTVPELLEATDPGLVAMLLPKNFLTDGQRRATLRRLASTDRALPWPVVLTVAEDEVARATLLGRPVLTNDEVDALLHVAFAGLLAEDLPAAANLVRAVMRRGLVEPGTEAWQQLITLPEQRATERSQQAAHGEHALPPRPTFSSGPADILMACLPTDGLQTPALLESWLTNESTDSALLAQCLHHPCCTSEMVERALMRRPLVAKYPAAFQEFLATPIARADGRVRGLLLAEAAGSGRVQRADARWLTALHTTPNEQLVDVFGALAHPTLAPGLLHEFARRQFTDAMVAELPQEVLTSFLASPILEVRRVGLRWFASRPTATLARTAAHVTAAANAASVALPPATPAPIPTPPPVVSLLDREPTMVSESSAATVAADIAAEMTITPSATEIAAMGTGAAEPAHETESAEAKTLAHHGSRMAAPSGV